MVKIVRKSSRKQKQTQRWVDDDLSGLDLGGNKKLLSNIRTNKNKKKNNNKKLSKEEFNDYRVREYMRRLPKIEKERTMNEYNIIDFDDIVNEDIVYETIVIGIPEHHIPEPIITGTTRQEHTVLTIDDYEYLLQENCDELPFDKDILPFMEF